jgi:hypothetical protein
VVEGGQPKVNLNMKDPKKRSKSTESCKSQSMDFIPNAILMVYISILSCQIRRHILISLIIINIFEQNKFEGFMYQNGTLFLVQNHLTRSLVSKFNSMLQSLY